MKKSKIVIIIVIIAGVGGLIWWGVASHKETKRQRAIVEEVRPLIEKCKKIGNTDISVRGKCLVWDMATNDRSDVHGMLYNVMKGSSSDNPLTVFMVLPERNVMVGRYSVSDEPAYRQYMDICVVYWPEKKPVGMHSIVSKEPRSSRPVENNPEYGDPNAPIAKWINLLSQSK
jgi:hypothetical protein